MTERGYDIERCYKAGSNASVFFLYLLTGLYATSYDWLIALYYLFVVGTLDVGTIKPATLSWKVPE